MSRRPIHAKKMAKLRKGLRRSLPAYIDLVDFLQTRGEAKTSGQARSILTKGRVQVDSHTVGRVQVPVTDALGRVKQDDAGQPLVEWVASPLVPAEYRDKIVVRRGRRG